MHDGIDIREGFAAYGHIGQITHHNLGIGCPRRQLSCRSDYGTN